jgi:type II secretory pathway component PulM
MQKIKFKIKIKSPLENQKVKEAIASLEQTVAKIIDYLMKLTPRERYSVIGGTVFVVLFILIVGIIGPLLHSRSKLDKAIALNDQQLRKIYQMSASIKALDSISKGNKDAHFTLISYLEEMSKQLGISGRVQYMKPVSDSTEGNRESVEVKIQGLYQDDLIGLLFGIENSQYPMKIKRFNLRKAEKGDVLDLTFQVVSYG